MNPLGLKAAIEAEAKKANVNIKVAAIYGDDVTVCPLLLLLFTLQESFADLQSRSKVQNFSILNEVDQLPTSSARLLSCNAYTGAFPIARALQEGAQIIVTGIF